MAWHFARLLEDTGIEWWVYPNRSILSHPVFVRAWHRFRFQLPDMLRRRHSLAMVEQEEQNCRALYGTPEVGTRNDHLTDANDAEIVHACFVLDAAYEEAGRQLSLRAN